MAFNSSSVSFSRFKILDQVNDALILSIPDKLRLFAFRDIDNSDEIRSFGWVPYEDMLDINWENSTPHLGEYLIFSFRLDTRRIAPAVLKKHIQLALRDEMAKLPAGKKFLSKNQKKEIMEAVTQKLYARSLPIPSVFNVLWKLTKNEIWLTSTQSKLIDLFVEYFTNSFDLHLEQMVPSTLAENFLDEKRCLEMEKLTESHFI